MLLHRLTRRSFSSSKPMIGFIGLGQMGMGMATQLVKSSYSVMGYDVFPESLQKAKAAGVIPAESTVDIAKNCSTIITMLRSNDQVVSVYDEILTAVNSGTLLIDSSTIDPATSQTVTTRAIERGCHMVDAPVSGGILKAASGQLTFMVGGSKDSFDRAQEYLAIMGAQTYHCGEKPGSGQVAKICNNLILGITMNAVAEGLNLGQKLGMDVKTLSEIVGCSSGACWSINQYNPAPGVMSAVPSSNNYQGGFAVDLMLKDLRLAQDAASSIDQQLNFGDLAAKTYEQISANGCGSKDFGIAFLNARGDMNDSK